MTDKGESELRKWALKRNGAPIDNGDIVALVFAFDDDNTTKFNALQEQLGKDFLRLSTIEETLRLVTDRQTAWELECPAREEALRQAHHNAHQRHMQEEHTVVPRRMDDPPDSEFTEVRESAFPSGDNRALFEIILGWSIFKWIIAAIVVALIGTGVAYLTSYFGSMRAENKIIHAEETLKPTPTVTVTVAPTP